MVNCFQDYSGKTFLPTSDLYALLASVSSHVGRGSMEGCLWQGTEKGRKEDPKFKAFKELNSAATILEADFLKVDLQIR